MEDTVLESARNVSIRMPNNVVTTYVKIQLWFMSFYVDTYWKKKLSPPLSLSLLYM